MQILKNTHHTKPTMVFLPGKQCDCRVWAAQINALSHLTNPICVDLRSYSTLDQMLDAVYNVSTEDFILVGFSLGGYVAQEFILKYPQKVKALALIGCSAKGYSEKDKQNYLTLIDFVKENYTSAMSGTALAAYMHPTNYKNKLLVEQIEGMLNDSGNEVFIRQQLATLNRVCRYNDLKKINAPAILIAGLQDKIVKLADAQMTAQLIQGAEFHTIDKCGHMIPMEQPEQLNELLRNWLKKIISVFF